MSRSIALPNEREDLLIAAAVFGVIGLILIVLSPEKQPTRAGVGNRCVARTQEDHGRLIRTLE